VSWNEQSAPEGRAVQDTLGHLSLNLLAVEGALPRNHARAAELSLEPSRGALEPRLELPPRGGVGRTLSEPRDHEPREPPRAGPPPPPPPPVRGGRGARGKPRESTFVPELSQLHVAGISVSTKARRRSEGA
jgi:hypothetical protein